ncbi:MAG: HD-GYP domain-containing protein [Treponema sp.]|nr:HD-GYP domain-containing protein [Treponema sp.]
MSKSNTYKNSKNKDSFRLPLIVSFSDGIVFTILSVLSVILIRPSINLFFIISGVLAVCNFIGFKLCLGAKKREKIEKEKMTEKAVELAITPFTVLMEALEAKDEYTEGHSDNVSKYAVMIGLEMGKTDDEILQLRLAGFVHDIGKVGIPDHILNKPGKLTDEEREVVKNHTRDGYKILKPIAMMPNIKTIAKSHHENFDGTGYPDGLRGERIHPLARIIRVADSYDAITSKRIYEKDKVIPSQQEIIQELMDKKGKEYDPEVVDAMIRIINKDKKFKLRSA